MKKNAVINFIKSLKDNLAEFILPKHLLCKYCGEDVQEFSKFHLCKQCKAQLPFIKNACQKCGRGSGVGRCCTRCLKYNYHFDRAVSAVNFTGIAKNSVYGLKFSAKYENADFMAYCMYCAYVNAKISADCIVCVPSNKELVEFRGIDHTKILMEKLNAYLKLPVLENCLAQNKNVEVQKALNVRDRFINAKKKFSVVDSKAFSGKSVLVIDDVLTTGATADRIAQLIKAGGAKSVYVLTFASVETLSWGSNEIVDI